MDLSCTIIVSNNFNLKLHEPYLCASNAEKVDREDVCDLIVDSAIAKQFEEAVDRQVCSPAK